MAMSREQFLSNWKTLVQRNRPWGNQNKAAPLWVFPGIDALYYEVSSYSLDTVRSQWINGLFLFERMPQQVDGMMDHFRVVYGFSCDSYLMGVFPTDRVALDRLSSHGRSMAMLGGRERGWYVPMAHWKQVELEALVAQAVGQED